MSIGTTIKKLRRERDMTQEQLAEYLGISACAISQWECDRTAPDISQIPLLVRIFGVTSDELLGISDLNKEADIERLSQEISELIRVGKHREGFELSEKAHRMYPDNYKLMYTYSLNFTYVYYDKSFPNDKKNKILAECTKLLESMMAGCTDDDLRQKAMSHIIWMYRESGQIDKAKEMVRKFPRMLNSYEFLRTTVLTGDERIDAHIDLLYHGLIQHLLNSMVKNYKDSSGKRFFSHSEMCVLYKKMIDILKIIFENGDLGFYFSESSDAHKFIAKYYAQEGDAENALTYLEGAADAVIAYLRDYYQKDYTHTSLLFKGVTTSGKEIWYQSNDNDASNLLSEMKKPQYDFIRTDERFTAIEERLAPFAGKWE